MRKLIGMLTVTAFAVALLMPVAAAAGDTPLQAVSEDGILAWKSTDNAFKWWIDARVYADVASYFDDGWTINGDGEYDPAGTETTDLIGGTFIRRARFAVKTILWTDWYAEVDMDFAEETVALKDAYMAYRGLFGGQGHVRVGNFRQPFGLEENFTSRNLLFMERSAGTDPFVVGRRMGVEVARWDYDWRAAASMYGADVSDFAGEKDDDETVNFAARVNYTPIHTDDSVLLLGAAGTLRKTDWSSHEVRFDVRPESYVADTKFTDTDNIDNVDKYNVFGGELAYVNKRFYAQGEYMMAGVKRLEGMDDLSFGGGYVYAGFFLTDDTHPYEHESAEFGRVVPRSKSGAWEVAARYSTLDLNDKDVEGGKANIMTLGVNWYANANIRVYMDYAYVNNDETAMGRKKDLPGNYDFGMFQMRFLAAF